MGFFGTFTQNHPIWHGTPSERKNPEIIDGSRRKRIADGSGRNVQEVNSLLKQFKQMKSMMNKMGKNKKFKLPFMGL